MKNRLTNCSRSEIAYLLSLSPSQVSRLRRQGLPVNPDNRTFDARAVHGWVLGRDQEAGSSTAESEETLEALARWRLWKCRREELAFKRESGELVPAAEALDRHRSREISLRESLQNLIPRLSGQLVGVKDRRAAEGIISDEIRALEAILHAGVQYTEQEAAAYQEAKKTEGTPDAKKEEA